MRLVPLPIYVTPAPKAFLEGLRSKGTTASGYIRSLLERELNQAPVTGRKGR